MILNEGQVLAICKKSAHEKELSLVRSLEDRHKLHIEGSNLLLEKFLVNLNSLESTETYQNRLKVSKPATKPIYNQVTNLINKVFTAHGANFYYEFSRPNQSVTFTEYLADTQARGVDFYHWMETVYKKVSLTGFGGVFLIDLPAQVNAVNTLPQPFPVYVNSSLIHDLQIRGFKVDYVTIKREEVLEGGDKYTLFITIDDKMIHVVKKVKDEFIYLPKESFPHDLDYAPVCPVSSFFESVDMPEVRTSIVGASIELADIYLRDHSEHELNKLLHAFQEKWSYGMKCNNVMPSLNISCDHGYFHTDSGKVVCSRCNGTGKIVPAGPDKIYMLEIPTDKNIHPDLRDPAGYISKDLAPTEYLAKCLELGELKIEKAILGKEGILNTLTKQQTGMEKEIDMQPVYDFLNTYKANFEMVVKFCTDAMARIIYPGSFKSSIVHYGDKFMLRSIAQMENEYDIAKKAGISDTILFGYLEDIIYAKYQNSPLELERERIKLYLTPFPTLSISEFSNQFFITTIDKTMRAYINDFIEQFERENGGSIVEFGKLLPFEKKIQIIKETIIKYSDDKKITEPVAAAVPVTT